MPEVTNQSLEDYLANPEIQQTHLAIAKKLYEIIGSKWFTVSKVIQKSLLKDPHEVTRTLMHLQLFKLATSKDPSNKNGANAKVLLWKLTISNDEKIQVLEDHILNHHKQIDLLKKEIDQLRLQAPTQEK